MKRKLIPILCFALLLCTVSAILLACDKGSDTETPQGTTAATEQPEGSSVAPATDEFKTTEKEEISLPFSYPW